MPPGVTGIGGAGSPGWGLPGAGGEGYWCGWCVFVSGFFVAECLVASSA